MGIQSALTPGGASSLAYSTHPPAEHSIKYVCGSPSSEGESRRLRTLRLVK